MFRGIKAIDALAKAQDVKNTPTTFNANLPVPIKVLAKIKGDEYLLQLGNTTINTKSGIPLKINAKYWANMQENAAGQIILNALAPQPAFMQNLKNMPLKLGFKDLLHLTNNPKVFMEEFKEFLLHQLAKASHKEEFSQLSSLLFSLQHNILSLVISDNNKEYIIQMQPKVKKQSLDFYAIFPHLGPISGQIYQQCSSIKAILNTMNERVQALLEKNKDKLVIEDITIICNTPKPLFDFSHSLLDVRG